MNAYPFSAGILLIFISFTHAFWGEKNLFSEFFKKNISNKMKISVYIPWHQSTFMLFIFGFFCILTSFIPSLSAVLYLILAVVAGNLIVFTLICIIKKESKIISQSVVQYVLFSILIILIILGIILN